MTASWPISVWGVWAAMAAVALTLFGRTAWRHHWPLWRCALFATGCVLAFVAAWGLHDPLATMAGYALALMTLGQLATPLLLIAFPQDQRAGWRTAAGGLPASWLLDPWVAGTVFVMLTLGINLPGVFDSALTNALFSAPLGLLLMLSGLMIWAQLLEGSRGISQRWVAGIYGWLISLPMMVTAAVWVWSSHVLYAPYLDILCVWNLSPLDDQHYAGLVMFITGLPLQLRSAWLLIMPAPESL